MNVIACQRCGKVPSVRPYFMPDSGAYLCFHCLADANPRFLWEVIRRDLDRLELIDRMCKEDVQEIDLCTAGSSDGLHARGFKS